MLKLTRLTPNIQPLMATSCRSVNKVVVRTKRNTFFRRPVKVLTDSGKDYFRETDFKEPISSQRLEVNPKVFNRSERFNYNKYYDEGLVEDLDEEVVEDAQRRQTISKKTTKQKNSYIFENQKEKIENISSDRQSDRQKPKEPKRRAEMQSETISKPKILGIPIYEKLGERNAEFIKMLSDIKQRKKREKENIMVLEGKRLISDAIAANCRLKTIYFTREENLVGIPNLESLVASGTALKKVFYRDMQLYSDVVTPPGVMAVCERPTNRSLELIRSGSVGQDMPLILVGENIRDPGNLGTMIRCAAAVGAHKVVFIKGCADAWESKVLRSGAGSHFRIAIASDVEWPLIFNHIPIDRPFDLFIADSNDNFSNKLVKHEETIVGQNESTIHSSIPSHTINTITKEVDVLSDQTFVRDESYDDSNPELSRYRNLSMASISYSDTKYYNMGPEKPIVLVIGGETHGLSNQSYKLSYDYIGRKIKIPLFMGVDSLNSAVAAAVIMYEMRRQFDYKHNSCQESIRLHEI